MNNKKIKEEREKIEAELGITDEGNICDEKDINFDPTGEEKDSENNE